MDNSQSTESAKHSIFPWFIFVNPKLFDNDIDDISVKTTQELSIKTALGLELIVLLAQPQPSWASIVKVKLKHRIYLGI